MQGKMESEEQVFLVFYKRLKREAYYFKARHPIRGLNPRSRLLRYRNDMGFRKLIAFQM